jgi:hypothetical protein
MLNTRVSLKKRLTLWIPIQGGQVFQPDGGHPTDLMAATLPI